MKSKLMNVCFSAIVGMFMLVLTPTARAWITAAYTLNGGSANLTNQTYSATSANDPQFTCSTGESCWR